MEESNACLPLAAGNTWTYTWNDLPAGYGGQEVYRVAAHQEERRYVESYGYLYRRP